MPTSKKRPQAKQRKHRIQRVAYNTMALAMSGAAVLPKEDVDAIITGVANAAAKLKAGVGTQYDWSIIAGHIDMAMAIEKQGRVKGLREHLGTIKAQMYDLRRRALETGQWAPPAAMFDDTDALNLFISLHHLQIESLSRSELRETLAKAKAINMSQGDTLEVQFKRQEEAA